MFYQGEGQEVKADLLENRVYNYFTVSTPDGKLHVSHVSYGGEEGGICDVQTSTDPKRSERIGGIAAAKKVAELIGGGDIFAHTIATIRTHQVEKVEITS